jgi:hypothetical protein
MKPLRLGTETLKFLTEMPNNDAIATDTSSEAAAAIPVVGPAAAVMAWASAERIPAKFWAASCTRSGAAITNDIYISSDELTALTYIKHVRALTRSYLPVITDKFRHIVNSRGSGCEPGAFEVFAEIFADGESPILHRDR